MSSQVPPPSPIVAPPHGVGARRHRQVRRLVSGMLSAALVLTVAQAVAPATALASTTVRTACGGVYMRSAASTAASIRTSVGEGVTVVAAATVSGGSWRTACNGVAASGSSWFRISTINGRTVSSLYGVSYVYAATSLFKAVATTTTTALASLCAGGNLRSYASTAAAVKGTLGSGTTVVATAKVAGSAWRMTCTGSVTYGSSWYRISTIGGRSVSSLYGVAYVYAATGLFRAATSSAPAPASTSGTKIFQGVDVSHWQGVINWTRVRASGRTFAYIKASEGRSGIDSMWASNRRNAKAAGLKAGGYHFAQPDATAGDAVAEADHFVRTLALVRGDLLPVLDLERTGGLSTSRLQAWVQTFLDRVYYRTGVRGVIYVSPGFWQSYMGNTTAFAARGYRVLWVAHWTSRSAPSMPASNWGSNGWTFWQYSATGSVPGISGRVDLDRYRGVDFSRVTVH